MSKKTKSKKTKPATKKVATAPAKSTAKQVAPTKATKVVKDNSKRPLIIALSVILGLGALAGGVAGGYFLGKNNSGTGGGGGYIPQPGDKVVTDVNVDNLPAGFSVTASEKAIIGEDYNTDIYLNEKEVSNNDAAETYVLPDALTKVSYKIGNTIKEIKKENYTYTVDSGFKQAHLSIDKEYVLGQIDIELTLTKVEATALKIDFEKNIVKVFDKDGKSIESGSAITVKKSTIALTCNILEDQQGKYKLTKDSFVLPNNPDATIDYNPTTGALSIYNVTKSGVLEIKEKSTDAILASIIPDHCSVIYDGITYTEQQTIEVEPTKEGNATFDIIADEGYILDKGSVFVAGGASYVEANFKYDSTDPQAYKVTVTRIKKGFTIGFNSIKLPDAYILLDGESSNYGAFNATADPSRYYNLTKDAGKGSIDVSFLPNDGFKDIKFVVKVYSETDELINAYYDDSDTTIAINVTFKHEATKSSKVIVTLIHPTDSPALTLDDASANVMTLTNDQGEAQTEYSLKDDRGKANSHFFFMVNKEVRETDPTKWLFEFEGIFGYRVENIKPSGVQVEGVDVYYADLYFDAEAWVGYNLQLHTVLPTTATAKIAAEAFDNTVNLYYEEKPIIADKKEQNIPVYVDYSTGEVNFKLEPASKEQIIIEDNIIIEGAEWKYEKGYLSILNVTQDQTFTIKKITACDAYKTIKTSVDKSLENVLEVIIPGTKIVLNQTPVDYSFDVTENISFELNRLAKITIESQWTATYTDENGTPKTVYGEYDGKRIIFPNTKVDSCNSLVISPKFSYDNLNSAATLFVDKGGIYDPKSINLNLNGSELSATMNVQTPAHPIKIYAVSEVDLINEVTISVTSKEEIKSYTVNVTSKPEGSDIFDYLITIDGAKEDLQGDSLTLHFNKPSI